MVFEEVFFFFSAADCCLRLPELQAHGLRRPLLFFLEALSAPSLLLVRRRHGRGFSVVAVALALGLGGRGGEQEVERLGHAVGVERVERLRGVEIVGQVLEPSGFISTLAGGATSITIRASGREVS